MKRIILLNEQQHELHTLYIVYPYNVIKTPTDFFFQRTNRLLLRASGQQAWPWDSHYAVTRNKKILKVQWSKSLHSLLVGLKVLSRVEHCQFFFLSSSPAKKRTVSAPKDFLISCRERGSARIWKQALADFFSDYNNILLPVLHAHVLSLRAL